MNSGAEVPENVVNSRKHTWDWLTDLNNADSVQNSGGPLLQSLINGSLHEHLLRLQLLVSWRGALRRFSLGNFIKNRKRFCDSIEISTKDVANVLTQSVTDSMKKNDCNDRRNTWRFISARSSGSLKKSVMIWLALSATVRTLYQAWW